MADSIESPSFTRSGRFRLIVGVVVLLVAVAAIWWWMSQGHESTDDAQVDAHMTQIASRVGGTVLKVAVDDNQLVEAGTVLVEIDPRDYQVAIDKAKAELADAEATAIAAQSNVPITSTSTQSGVSTAQSGLDQARSVIDTAGKEVEVARARLTAAQSRVREAEANATRARRDVERLKGLLAKDEVSQQQYDAAVRRGRRSGRRNRHRQGADRRSGGRDPDGREPAGAGAGRGTVRPGRAAQRADRAGAGHRNACARLVCTGPRGAGQGHARPG